MKSIFLQRVKHLFVSRIQPGVTLNENYSNEKVAKSAHLSNFLSAV